MDTDLVSTAEVIATTETWEIWLSFLELFFSAHMVAAYLLLFFVLRFRQSLKRIVIWLFERSSNDESKKVVLATPFGDLRYETERVQVEDPNEAALEDAVSQAGKGIPQNLADPIANPSSTESELAEKYKDLWVQDDSVLLPATEEDVIAILAKNGLETDSDTARVLIRNFASVTLGFGFERDYMRIRGSEILLLERMNARVQHPYSVGEIESFISDLAVRYPHVYKDHSVDKYLSFLLANSLVLNTDGGFNITVRGQAFLMWILKNNKSKDLNL